MARVAAARAALLLPARPVAAEVAVVYNPLSHFVGGRQRATAYAGPQGEVAGIERDSLLGVYQALFPTNVPLDFVHAERLDARSLAGYKLVVLPYPLMLPARTAAELREYVRAGGALVLEARAGWNDERGHAADVIPGLGLAEVAGARETDVQTVAKGDGGAGRPRGAARPRGRREASRALVRGDARARVGRRARGGALRPGGAPAASCRGSARAGR